MLIPVKCSYLGDVLVNSDKVTHLKEVYKDVYNPSWLFKLLGEESYISWCFEIYLEGGEEILVESKTKKDADVELSKFKERMEGEIDA